jgi:hypothetical protein
VEVVEGERVMALPAAGLYAHTSAGLSPMSLS